LDYSEHAGVDLHIHSTASDGTLSPSEIVSMACECHLRAISITDHDTIEGSRQALDQGIPPSIQFLIGVEISAAPLTEYSTDSSYHILGYGMDLDDPELNRVLNKLQRARKDRNPDIIEKLQASGFEISLQEVCELAGEGLLGRPHIARVMLEKGYVASIDQAFDDYLGKGRSAYVDKYRVDIGHAIELIINSGGIPVLAHPGLLEPVDDAALDALVAVLKKMGLMGIEVFYPNHTPEQVNHFLALAADQNLLVTGGTDFHGELKPEISLGTGDGSLFVPFALFEALLDKMSPLPAFLEIERTLGHTFQNRALLKEALSHSSFVNEHANPDLRDNERFEFLGDAVLNLVVGDLLMRFDPDLREGVLTRIRSAMVNETQLAKISRSIDLGRHILLGKGEAATGGRDKNSILADTLEAVLAAVYLDGGYAAAFQTIENHFSALIESLVNKIHALDYKSELQEYVQCLHQTGPVYTLHEESGPDHDKTFHIKLDACNTQTVGVGKSKKAAEQDAARKALEILRQATEGKPAE